MTKAKVWRAATGEMYHDACFEDDETLDWREQNGYKELQDVSGLDDSDTCDSCDGPILGVPLADDDDDDDVDDEEEPA